MSEVSVELNAVTTALNNCRSAQSEIKNATAKMLRQYDEAGKGWKDKKYRELGQIVDKCRNALEKPFSDLQKCEVFLTKLQKSIKEYESISFSSGGTNGAPATGAPSSAARQYGAVNQGRRISNRRHSRMSQAASRGIDYIHERAIRNYCGDGYRDINGRLRGTNTRETSPDYAAIIQDDIDRITETLDERRLGRNMTLYRGVSNPRYILGDNWQNTSEEELNNANNGRVFQDSGFCSTSVDPDGAAEFAQSYNGAMIIIQAPADANGMAVGAYNSRTSEREVLLQRDSNFRIDSVSRTRYGNCVIRVTLIGRG
ncbi:MAG: hypothetical protein IJS67_03380 [Clostridia bacterium]|nr:hypothetical protein [Clostridia bacterium]